MHGQKQIVGDLPQTLPLLAEDKGVLHQLGHVDPGIIGAFDGTHPAGHVEAGRNSNDGFFLEQGNIAKLTVPEGAVEQREVDLVRLDLLFKLIGCRLDELDADVGHEPMEQRKLAQQKGSAVCRQSDPDRADVQITQIGKILIELLSQHGDSAGIFGIHLSFVGQHQLRARARNEGEAKPFLQLLEENAQRGLRDVERFRCPCDAAVIHDGKEIRILANIHRNKTCLSILFKYNKLFLFM